MGTVRRAQGAINKQHGKTPSTAWIDVKKAYDSIDHEFLRDIMDHLKIPTPTKKFVETALTKWKVNLFLGGKMLTRAKINRGILQGDSLSR
jgi:hypothetical protein